MESSSGVRRSVTFVRSTPLCAQGKKMMGSKIELSPFPIFVPKIFLPAAFPYQRGSAPIRTHPISPMSAAFLRQIWPAVWGTSLALSPHSTQHATCFGTQPDSFVTSHSRICACFTGFPLFGVGQNPNTCSRTLTLINLNPRRDKNTDNHFISVI